MPTVEVKAELTGVVCAVDTEVGCALEKGTNIMVLESMKMEFGVESPCVGVLEELLVRSGDSVEEGMTLARVRTED